MFMNCVTKLGFCVVSLVIEIARHPFDIQLNTLMYENVTKYILIDT